MTSMSTPRLHTHTQCEEMFITLNNACQFTHNNRTAQVEGAASHGP
jgi:hypothetical protein